jgi:hypothetical protein
MHLAFAACQPVASAQGSTDPSRHSVPAIRAGQRTDGQTNQGRLVPCARRLAGRARRRFDKDAHA